MVIEASVELANKLIVDDSDDDDDKPISFRRIRKNHPSSELHDTNSTVSVKGEKHNEELEDSDDDDDKPLSARVPVGLSQKRKHPVSDVEDSDDDKPLSATRKASGVKMCDDSDDEKPILSKYDSSTAKKVSINSAKRASSEAFSGSSTKKAKHSDASTSAKADQRMNETASGSKQVCVKKKVAKVQSSSKLKKVNKKSKKVMKKSTSSKLKKVNKKSKKVMKKSTYAGSSKELPNSSDGKIKWTTLVHNGVIFPPPYQPHGVKMLYDGKPVDLSPEQEEVATMYAVMLETDYVKEEKFNENFFSDWKELLGGKHVIQDFKKCDFTPIHEWHLREKERKKQMSREEKKALKEEKLKQEEKYKWAILDGVKEKVGTFRVEPPGLFRGRGDHPKNGKLKKRIYPRDVTINIGKDAPIPECPIPGQSWKEIMHDNTVTWLAFWENPIEQNEYKYVFLAASSSLKTQSDKEKYENARKLKDYINGIRAAYTKDFSSKDETKQQIAVATYLIDRLALRAGNEKDADKADTVGCCTLKVEHVKPIPPNTLEFDFLGKDSIKYYKQFEAEPLVYKAVQKFRKGKRGSDDLFHKLDTSKLNTHLKELMPGLTAKVFRTFNASFTLDEMLAKGAGSGEVQEKIVIYQHANKEVAIICNHQRTIPKSHSAQMGKRTTKINEAKAELSELEKDLARAKKGKPPLNSDGKRKRNLTPEAIEKKIVSTKTKIEKYERDMQNKEDVKGIALSTSKTNYLDPRITVAWCKRNEVPIDKVFNKSLLEKFSWAMDVDPSFRF